MNEVYERFEIIRETVGDTLIVDAIAQMFSNAQLTDLCDDLEHEYCLNEIEEDEDWDPSNS